MSMHIMHCYQKLRSRKSRKDNIIIFPARTAKGVYMKIRYLDKITFPELVVEVVNTQGERLCYGIFTELKIDVWIRQIVFIQP